MSKNTESNASGEEWTRAVFHASFDSIFFWEEGVYIVRGGRVRVLHLEWDKNNTHMAQTKLVVYRVGYVEEVEN